MEMKQEVDEIDFEKIPVSLFSLFFFVLALCMQCIPYGCVLYMYMNR